MVVNGFAKSREQANSLLMSGNVFVNEKRVEKGGQQVKTDSKIEIKGKTYPWVSRGGVKLEKAILEFNLNCNLIIALDIGASTGGFTDVLLSRGAKKITFVENDERVIKILKQNLESLKITNNANIVIDKIENFLKKNLLKKFEIIFLDPPFVENNYIKELKMIKEKKIYKKNHIIVIHREIKSFDNLEEIMNPLIIKEYGRSKIIFGKFLN